MSCPAGRYSIIIHVFLSCAFQVGSVMFSPGHLSCLLTLGVYTALVMDVGYTETLVVPVSFNFLFMFTLEPVSHTHTHTKMCVAVK